MCSFPRGLCHGVLLAATMAQGARAVAAPESGMSGFLFDNGNYLPPPYQLRIVEEKGRVSIRAGSFSLYNYPFDPSPAPVAQVAPPPPFSMPWGAKGLRDSGYGDWVAAKLAYETTLGDVWEAITRVCEGVARSPLIDELYLDVEHSPPLLRLRGRDGSVFRIPSPRLPSREDSLHLARLVLSINQGLLDHGGAFLRFDRGDLQIVRVSGYEVPREWPELIERLDRGGTVEEKTAAVGRIIHDGTGRSAPAVLLASQLRPTPALRARIAALPAVVAAREPGRLVSCSAGGVLHALLRYNKLLATSTAPATFVSVEPPHRIADVRWVTPGLELKLDIQLAATVRPGERVRLRANPPGAEEDVWEFECSAR